MTTLPFGKIPDNPTPSSTPHSQFHITPGDPNSIEMKMRAQQDTIGWCHSRPNSVLIACIGNHWKPGSWQHIVDMMKFTLDKGIYCELIELQDRCFNYADALGTMRNEAIFQAQLRGLEWLLTVENDVWPPQDALVKLLNWHYSTRANIIVPYICEQGTGRPLHGPGVQPDSGFHWMKWTVLSFALYKTCIFNHYPTGFWRDTIGADEGYHFQQLYRDGYYIGMDTGLQVATLRRPQYPLATNHLEAEERRRHWDYINTQRLQPPDRRPVNPGDKLVDEQGNYNPFIRLPEPEKVGDIK